MYFWNIGVGEQNWTSRVSGSLIVTVFFNTVKMASWFEPCCGRQTHRTYSASVLYIIRLSTVFYHFVTLPPFSKNLTAKSWSLTERLTPKLVSPHAAIRSLLLQFRYGISNISKWEENFKPYYITWSCMGAKLGLSLLGTYSGTGFSRIWCWGRQFGLTGTW